MIDGFVEISAIPSVFSASTFAASKILSVTATAQEAKIIMSVIKILRNMNILSNSCYTAPENTLVPESRFPHTLKWEFFVDHHKGFLICQYPIGATDKLFTFKMCHSRWQIG